jgi:predicted site-specific integrase-resolvase
MTLPRCYTIAQILDRLQIPRRTFFTLRKAGKIKCLEELKPRIGRRVRYRADLVDRYLENEWRPRAVPSDRKIAS